MYKYLVGIVSILVFVGAGCSANLDTGGKNLDSNQESKNSVEKVTDLSDVVSKDNNSPTETTKEETPQITSASFDGNGVVIQGKNLSGSYLAFTTPSLTEPCRELITPNCVLQKTVSTDTSIKFISNHIGGNGNYQIYVENATGEVSNKVNFIISSKIVNEELNKEEMEAELKTFFEQEKGKAVTKINVTSQDGVYVRGEVSFAQATDELQAGAIFFVKKENEKWALTHYGNGQIPCSLETKYGFPKTFLWDCAE